MTEFNHRQAKNIARLVRCFVLTQCILIKASAQPPSNAFINLNEDGGFTSSYVNSITQDSSGFIWLGASNGLNRYNGTFNTRLNNSPHSNNTISDNYINVTFTDKHGDVWIGTRKGLNVYDLSEKKWRSFLNDPEDPTSLSDNEVWSIAQDRAGSLWIGTINGGLNRVNEIHTGDSVGYSFTSFKTIPDDKSSISSNTAYAIYFDEYGNGWVGTQRGLNRFMVPDAKSNHLQFTRYNYNPADSSGITSDFIKRITSDRQGNLWLTGGLKMLDKIDNRYLKNNSFLKVEHYFSRIASNKKLQDSTFLSLLFDKQGGCWIGTSVDGLLLVPSFANAVTSNKSLTVYRYKTSSTETHSLINNRVFSLLEDRSGNIWVGTEEGISILPVYSSQFTPPYSTSKSELGSVSAFFIDSCENKWFASEMGIMIVKRGEVKPKLFLKNPFDELMVTSILVTPDGSLWIGTNQDGLYYYSSKSVKERLAGGSMITPVHHFTDLSNEANSISYRIVNDLSVYKQGSILVSTMGGLDIVNPAEASVKNLFYFKNYPHSRTKCYIRSATESSDGIIWAGSDDGLLAFNVSDKYPVEYHFKNGDSTSLPSDRILKVYEDSRKMLWVCTQSGISFFDSRNKAFRTLTMSNGLPSNNVTSIVEDHAGKIWLGTDKGLSCYNTLTRQLKNFDKEDGLLSNQVEANGLAISPDGMIHVLTNKGINTFYPEKLYKNLEKPRLILTAFKVNGESIESAKYTELNKKFLWNKEMKLRFDQNFFTIDFSTISFVHPDRDQFAYMLEGLDKNWNFIGNRNTAYFNNVPPGHYSFKLRAKNGDGEWNNAGISLPITIIPPWWKTLWFRTLIVLLIIIVIVMVTRYFAQQRLKEKLAILEKQRAVEHERQRISRDMHDELGSGISIISMMINRVKQEQLTPTGKEEVEKIAVASSEMVTQLREIVWTLNPKNDYLKDLLVYLRKYAMGFFENLPIECKVTMPAHIPEYVLSGEVRRALFLVIKESLNNLLKHSQAKKAQMEMQIFDHHLVVEITDDGVGIDESKMNFFGNGLKNMARRMEDIGGSFKISSENGTKTKITFPIAAKQKK